MTPGGIAAVCGAALLTGFSKTGLPGIGMVIPSLAAMAMPARASTGFILPVLIEGDSLAVAFWRRNAAWPRIARILPWTALGVIAGYFLMGALSDAIFRPLLGAMILAVVGLDIARRAAKAEFRADSRLFAAVMGVLAGAFTMLANAAGPVMTIYLLSMGLSKEEFVGTGAWFYFFINLIKLPFSIALGLVTWDTLKADLALAPLVLSGGVAGVLAMRRLPQRIFEVLALVLAVLCGAWLFF